jgi:hypothetical protein
MTITINCTKCNKERTIDLEFEARIIEPQDNHTGIGFYTDYEGVQFYCKCGE